MVKTPAYPLPPGVLCPRRVKLHYGCVDHLYISQTTKLTLYNNYKCIAQRWLHSGDIDAANHRYVVYGGILGIPGVGEELNDIVRKLNQHLKSKILQVGSECATCAMFIISSPSAPLDSGNLTSTLANGKFCLVRAIILPHHA
jgi:hypothetical protein